MKDNSTKKVLSNSFIYVLCGILQKGFSLLLLPLYTVYLTPGDYGITNIALTFSLTMNFVISFSLYSSIMRFYVDYKDDGEKLKRFYGTIFNFVALSGFTFLIFSILLKQLFENYIFGNIPYFPIIFICCLTLIFTCENTIYDYILKSQQKALKNGIINLIYFFVQLGFNIYFVVFMKLGAKGVLLSSLLCGIIFNVFYIFDLLKNKMIKFCFDFKILKKALRYSIPLMPHDLSTRFATMVSSVLIGNTINMSSLGIYSVASQFGTVTDTISGYVNNAYTPWLFQNLNDKNDKETSQKDGANKIANLSKAILFLLGGIFICIAAFSQDFIILFTAESYHSGWHYIPFLIMIYTIKNIYYFYVSFLLYYSNTSKKIFIATLTGSLINTILSIILIPNIGVFGSIISDGVGILSTVMITTFIAKKNCLTNINLGYMIFQVIFISIFVFVILIPSAILYNNEFSIINLIYKIFIVFLYFFIIYIIYHKSINDFIKSKKKKIID